MEPQTTLGRYQIQSLLGKGGMGEVYKAFDPGLDRTVALKTIRPDGDNPTFLDRLYREAKACGRLRHPGIVTVYDIGEADGIVFIAMEYLEGDNLGAAIAGGKLSFEQKVKALIQILDALEYAHKEGVVHRDIKPSNIHLLPNGDVKLLDFGLARVTRAESLTMTGAVMGTPYYMSPEQLKGQKVDGRTDVFSTGVLAYELFTHRRAFEGEGITTVMMKVLSEAPPPMETAWSAAFPEIEKIVARAMAKNVEDRYATAEDMKNALAAFLAASHASIAKAQADVTIQTQRAVFEAQTLLQQGQHAQSQALLAETLKMNPDAKEARTLMQQATQVLPAAPQAPAARDPKPTAIQPQGAEAQRPAAISPAQKNTATTQGTKGNRAVLFAVVATLIVMIGVTAVVYQKRSAALDSGSAPAPTTNPASGATAKPLVPVQPPTGTPPEPGRSNEPASPAASPSGGTSTQATATSQPPSAARGGSPSGPASGAQQIPAPVRANGAGGVQVETAGVDAALATALTEALKSKGVPVQSGSAGARLSVRAQSQVNIRPAPFQGSSAITADYTGSLQLRDRTSNSSQTLSFDGHAMEFGEAVVRQAAIRALADQMAEAIKNAFHN